MAGTATSTRAYPQQSPVAHELKRPRRRFGSIVFVLAIAAGIGYIATEITRDMESVQTGSVWPFLLLALALLIALGFEFVNGFHDTANAVATVIYTHSLEPNVAVVWSGLCNLAGVLASTGTVAFAVVMLLPVELILKVSSGGGHAMVFALLMGAILWNLGTWWFGLPASSTHTMIGSIIGVGLANQLLNWRSGVSGLDWTQALKVLEVLLVSPLVGFACAGLLMWASKRLVRVPSLYQAPKNSDPPPWPIRALLVLILIGTFPTAYALNHDLSAAEVRTFITASQQAGRVLNAHVDPGAALDGAARAEAVQFIRSGKMRPTTMLAVRNLVNGIGMELGPYKTFQAVPAQDQTRLRNDMYVAGEALHMM